MFSNEIIYSWSVVLLRQNITCAVFLYSGNDDNAFS